MENRTIKFRVWNPIGKRMLYDSSLEIQGNRIFSKYVMEFTGLKDKNGKDIYEGDILRYNYHIVYGDNWKGSRENNDFFGVVEYHDKILKVGYESDETRFVGFILRGCPDTEQEYFTPIPLIEDIEVIGNIYENRELLGCENGR